MDNVLAQLDAHIAAHRLVERAEEGFRAWLAEPADGLPGDWGADGLHAAFESLHLCLRPAHVNYPYFDTRLRILRGNEQVGHYRLITKLDGTAVDDYFVLLPEHG